MEQYISLFTRNIIESLILPSFIAVFNYMLSKIVWRIYKDRINDYLDKLKKSDEVKTRLKKVEMRWIKGFKFILERPFYIFLVILILFCFVTFSTYPPNVIGKSSNSAKKLALDSKMMFEIDRHEYNDEPEGTVIYQSPHPSKILLINSLLQVVISKGKPEIPDLIGMNEEDAERVADRLKLSLDAERIHSNDPKGTIISQSPKAKKGKKISIYTEIKVTVSKGKPKVPDLIGKNKAEAETLLKERKLIPVIKEEISDKQEGTVIKQSIEPNATVNIDTQVVIVISRPQPLEIASPSHQGLVSWRPTVEVQYDSIRNNEYAWIIVLPHGTNAWHPQLSELDIVIDSSGSTWKTIYIGEDGSADIGRQFDIAVALTDGTAHQVFKSYMSNAIANQEYPGIADLPNNTAIIHKITVTRQ